MPKCRVGHQPDRSSQYSDQQRRDIQGRYRERLPYGQGVLFFLILTDSCIYAARDKFGRTPIIIGKNEFGYVVASESSSFTNLGYNIVRDLGPHEAIRVSKDGLH